MSDTTTKVKHGWVLEDTEKDNKDFRDFLNEYGGRVALKKAEVFLTRSKARTVTWKLNGDAVRKVEVDENGKAIKIIPGR